MRSRPRTLPAALTVLALCTALSSCGGDSSDDDAATSTSGSVIAASTTDATGDEDDETGTTDEAPAATTPNESVAPSSVLVTPPTTEPPTTEPPTTEPPSTEPISTGPATTTDLPDDGLISEFDALLLTGEDVGPEWEAGEIDEYTASSEMDTESCPAAASINDVDGYLVTQIDITDPAFNAVNSAIGRAPSGGTLAEIVSRFGEIHLCDTTELFGTGDASGGPIEVPGATSASVLRLTSDQTEFVELAIVAVDDVVVVIGVFWSDPADLSGLVEQLAATAVEKVTAG